jgi:hypothetical protein
MNSLEVGNSERIGGSMVDDIYSTGRERANHKSMALGNSGKEDIVEKMKN